MAGKKKDEKPAQAADGEEGAPAPKKLAGKTLVLFVVLPALLLVGGGGGAAFFLMKPSPEAHAEADDGHGAKKSDGKKEKKDDHGASKGDGHGGAPAGGAGLATVTAGDGVYYVSLPSMMVNFTADDGRPAFLKLKLTLEAANEDVAYAVDPELPRIMDQFQGFLRELRMEDISGSAGAERLRLELLRRVNLAIAPEHVNAVLIEEMLVQ
jgi:flagellar FliL protein